ncbi:MAG: group II intron reverse transcriptase/maturase [Gammaproteobacteria bacterium]|nr:group II intron reverse transcriptase/maturase [Gammaproteobacteria bacterium]
MLETTRQDTETSALEWGWVEACVWNERMLAALDNGVKGGKWFSLIDKVYAKTTLRTAWETVRKNRGAAGVDQITIERFDNQSQRYLDELHEQLKTGNYHPHPVRRVEIPKAEGKRRPLGIPVVKDRVVQAAAKKVIEPIFEKDFLPVSYGFRPGKGCKDALREVDELIQSGYVYVVDADIRSYFDSISHDMLMRKMEKRISDEKLLRLIGAFLKQDIFNGLEQWTPTKGTPQGAVLSPLLANIYLHDLDVLLTEHGFNMVRYADDFVVLCESHEQATCALENIRSWMAANRLELHPDKTHLGDCRQVGQGFEFLGYRFEAGQRWVRRKSMRKLRDAIRSRTARGRGVAITCVIEELNPILRGWFEYFKHAHRYTFTNVDGFVRRRLPAILRKQQRKRPGQGHALSDHKRWPNAFFATHGLFTMTQAYARASRSR